LPGSRFTCDRSRLARRDGTREFNRIEDRLPVPD